MPKICYVPRKFSQQSLDVINRANAIVAEYSSQGFSLTLRQLYYQFVARGWIANRQTEYDRLGGIINDARLAGEVDWNAIEDRTRWLRRNDIESGDPGDYLKSVAEGYSRARWADQPWAPEVWIEKDALIGIVESVCEPLSVPYFACRGYASQSEVWLASQRMIDHHRRGAKPIIFHLGDHDPSGLDMTRDLEDRLALFCRRHGYEAPEIIRLALNMEQVEELSPPPNPAKMSDSRAAQYVERYGDESWELDAIDPTALADLIRENLEPLIDQEKWRAVEESEEHGREQLRNVASQWELVSEFASKPRVRDFDGGWR